MSAKQKIEPWLSVEDIAEYLSVKPDTIYKWISRNEFPAHKAGKLWRFRASDVDAWVKAKEVTKKKTNK